MKKRILCMAMVLCMVMALLPVTAFAATGDIFEITTTDGQAKFVVGSNFGANETWYCKANAKYPGGFTTGGNESDYILRLKHSDAGWEVTLRNAYLTTNATGTGGPAIVITSGQRVTINLIGENEIENRLPYGGAAIRVAGSGGAVITSDDGKGSLNLSNLSCGTSTSGIDYFSVIDCNSDLRVEKVALNITSTALQGDSYAFHGIRCGGNLVIDNADVTIQTAARAIFMGKDRRESQVGSGSVTITNGSDVTLSGRYQAIMTNGQIKFDATGGTKVALNAGEPIFQKDITVTYGNHPAFTKTPIMTGTYTATASSDKTLAETTPYEAEENVALTTSANTAKYRYFRFVGIDEPVLTEPMVAPVLNNTLDMDVAIAKSAVDADGYAMFVPADGGEPVRANLVDDPKDDSIYVARLTGLAAKQMTDSYTVTIYDGRGVEASLPRTFSIADYAIAQLRATDDAELKTLLVDMLVYGAMAQTQFGHNADKLATAGLSAEELDLATQTMKPCVNDLKSAAGYLGTTFILESSIAMATAYDKAVVGEGAYAVVSFTNYEGTAITSEEIYASEYSNDDTVVFISNDMVAADGRCEITWTIYNAAGEKVVEITDSLASYTKRAMDAGDDFVAKVMIYADSDAAFLGK